MVPPSGDAASGDSTPGIVNLDDADLFIEDLRTDPEIRAELSLELADQLGLSTTDADCLADGINVEDLLAMSAAEPVDTVDTDSVDGGNGGDGADTAALERILEAFDACDVPRSVFDR